MRGILPWLPLALVASACGGAFQRMPDRPVVWVDPDRRAFGPAPEDRYVSWRYDAIDQTLLRPTSEAFAFGAAEEAVNVNALGEVPDSSWFENRIGRAPLSPEAVGRGACARFAPEAPRPWTVVGGKPDGSHPGLTIEDADGVRYLLKVDGHQPERATAADAIAAALHHAAGYHVPCNRVHYVARGSLVLGPDAQVEQSNTRTRPLVEADIDFVLSKALERADGRRRVGLSRFVDGEPLGPWSYTGTRDDDPNDVVAHERRRDLRGLYLLAAWTGHIDARQENTLGAFVDAGADRGWIRHYLIDFGDCFGVTHGGPRLSRRFEHDHVLNVPNVLADTLTLGLIDRPWLHEPTEDRMRETLGYFDATRFRPTEWAPTYPNPAFDARTEHDDAWTARILARFSRAHVRAAVQAGRLSDPAVERRLVEVLWERRRMILERYLARLSPLAWPRGDGSRVCLEDLAVSGGIVDASARRDRARRIASLPPRPGAALTPRRNGARVCVEVDPALEYAAVDLVVGEAGPARLHLYARSPGTWHVAGLERLAPRDGGFGPEPSP